MIDTVFNDLQEAAATMLRNDPFFKGDDTSKAVPVLTEQIGNLVSKIETNLSKLGVSALVATPVAEFPEPDVATIDLVVPLVVQISESVLLNQSASGTKKPALACVAAAMRILHQKPHGVTNGSPKVCKFRLAKTPFTLIEQDPTLSYNVHFTAVLTLPS